jgi:hypothetical protein
MDIFISSLSADQHKQIGILQRATSLNIRTVLIKQNGNYEKSQDFKGRSEKFKTQQLFLVGA